MVNVKRCFLRFLLMTFVEEQYVTIQQILFTKIFHFNLIWESISYTARYSYNIQLMKFTFIFIDFISRYGYVYGHCAWNLTINRCKH